MLYILPDSPCYSIIMVGCVPYFIGIDYYLTRTLCRMTAGEKEKAPLAMALLVEHCPNSAVCLLESFMGAPIEGETAVMGGRRRGGVGALEEIDRVRVTG
jgi:hypothetical protein